MSQPTRFDQACLLISEIANQLGHNAIGHRGRRWVNFFLGLSALLGAVAGSVGLADLVSKTWVSIITLAATASTAVVIILLTTLKYDAHLRAQGKYSHLYNRTLACNMATEAGQRAFILMWTDFGNVVNEVDTDQASLSNRQVRKYEKKARSQLDAGMQDLARLLTNPPPAEPSGLEEPPPPSSNVAAQKN